ncbi:troponin T, skeletal muscle isoform X3 [Culex quinquefasciatus]|uniref:troponin T, skeletal muscle isoform X3 n=1 Tax=Culex quinquefasciatus TaxID=7176 RepID=UPI0018E2D2AE|nr:troponin T, skeletal muscle isoform X3 [Culex quinquefasciatus]
MSDDEEYSSEEEEEVVVEEQQQETGDDPEFIKRQDQKRSDLDEQLKDYINEWRKQRAKEEDELKRLKDKQAKRKVSRAEEEQRMAQRKKEEEERRVREIEEKKQREIDEKRRRLEEAEKKRQAMLQAMKDKDKKGPNFTITKKDSNFGMSNAQMERNKTKEQLEEEKKISLSFRIKPLELDGLSADTLRTKATELWETIVKLETEKYDLEERQKRQDYDLKELKERQKQQLRHKALKKGLDPEALTGKYPPMIQVASKYERRVDTRSYDDKKKLFEGGFDTLNKESLEKQWSERKEQHVGRQKSKLPKWFGERPGKRAGDPETPEGEDEVKPDDEEIEEVVVEEVVEEEEEEEEEEEVSSCVERGLSALPLGSTASRAHTHTHSHMCEKCKQCT